MKNLYSHLYLFLIFKVKLLEKTPRPFEVIEFLKTSKNRNLSIFSGLKKKKKKKVVRSKG